MGNNWWKAPILQGPENEYGDYDYLIEEIPENKAKWEISKYAWKCDDCGKESHLLFSTTSYFYTLDGYDYMSYNTCWRCYLKEQIHKMKYHIKHYIVFNIEQYTDMFHFALKLYRQDPQKRSFIFWCSLIRKIQKGKKK